MTHNDKQHHPGTMREHVVCLREGDTIVDDDTTQHIVADVDAVDEEHVVITFERSAPRIFKLDATTQIKQR